MKPSIELLESRKLLAGVTLLTHGQSGNVTGWIAEAADGIVDRLGGAAAASIYTMVVDESDDALVVTSFQPDEGFGDYRSTSLGELIIRLDWSDVSGGSFSTGEVAEVVTAYMLAPRTSKKLPPLAELPMHLVGHSRGASLVVELSRLFGRVGVAVDQNTYLDPHPVEGVDDIFNVDFGDAPMDVFDNVVFADNYWRTDGNTQNFDPDGEPVDGVHEGDLNSNVQQAFFVSAHNAVTAYYVGTIDLDANDGGDHPVNDTWYDSPNPAREETGFIFSRLGGGSRPADGLGSVGRGSSARTAAGQAGAQWPSAVELKPNSGNSFESGASFNVTLRGGDRDSSATATVLLDIDRNPYNGAGTQIGSKEIDGAIDDETIAVQAANVSAGTYALAVQLKDAGGRTRWFYGRSVSITPGAPIGEIEDRILKINGGDGKDTFNLQLGGGGTLAASLNGRTTSFDLADFDRIELMCGAGNDVLTASINLTTPIYAFGDAGNDSLTGGGGMDTLTGAAGRNFLDGGPGDDRVNGSGANDTLFGSDGGDRLYGNGGDDQFEGGGGVDRVFAGDGNDFAVGGGSNDKLYGEAGDDTLIGKAGADIIDGDGGNDSREDDSSDIVTSVENVV